MMIAQELQVNWRKRALVFQPGDRLILAGPGFGALTISLWPPSTSGNDWPFRDTWVADAYVDGFGFVAGKGATAQAALDDFDAQLPMGPMVRGGTC